MVALQCRALRQACDRTRRRRRQAAAAVCRDPEGARHPGLQLREDRRRAEGEGTRQRRHPLERPDERRSAEAEGDPRVGYITQHVDGIAISALNGDFLTDTINKAVDAGIPVVTWDSDAPKSKRMAFYGVDDFAVGPDSRRADRPAAERQGQGRDHHERRRHEPAAPARRRARKRSPRRPGIQIVEIYDIKEDSVRCAELIATGTNRYPDLGAWLSVGGWPVFTRNATAPIDPAKTKVISFDTIQPALDLLREGKVQVLLGQKYFGWGSEPVQAALRHQARQDARLAHHRLRRGRRHEGERGRVRASWKKMESGS